MSHFTPDQIAAAQSAQRKWLVPASVTLAQFAIESAYGTHMPAGSNNPFGIKAMDGHPFVLSRTREVIKGKSVYIEAKFRKFADFAEAFDAHAELLATHSVYAAAMHAWSTPPYNLDEGVRLMAKKYATAPDYATIILSVIHGQHLQQYDHA